MISNSLFPQRNQRIFFATQYIDPLKDAILLMNNVASVNAAIIVLVKNSELDRLLITMENFEDRWNKKYNYPYVFLNDEEFTQEFKDLTKSKTQSETQYGNYDHISLF
ncbi:glycosyltransferase family 15 protein [Gigaspora margarita]|uniref:Glycosyltransferase family 15 protein n=1 Tax=Gigaspora margarita TaxID=4874 RepID=A0A8H4AQ37_GIGMA|nr:glycosyltransferase family 15 protein [Gigaspora margarita]